MITLSAAHEQKLQLPNLMTKISGCKYGTIIEVPEFKRNPLERTADDGLGPHLSRFYREHQAEWDALPKSKEEANRLGVKGFDGLQVSVRSFKSLQDAELSPMRYSVLTAYQRLREQLLKDQDFIKLAELERENPYLIGAGVYAVTKYKGEPHIMMQIKGNAAGAGQIHSALIGGGLSMKEFQSEKSILGMFHDGAVRQAQEELGLQVSPENLGAPALLRIENATGNMAVGFVLSGFQGEEVLDAYIAHTSGKQKESADDSAAGVVLVPLRGILNISPEKRPPNLLTGKEVIVDADGRVTVSDSFERGLRPAAQGFLAALEDPVFVRHLLERAGY